MNMSTNTSTENPTPVLTTNRSNMAFCPGCTHTRILECLTEAVGKIGIDANKVCIVSDIGCIGISDRYLGSHTFHGLHGRSITYAEGIKRARPDLTVAVLIGDGGCGIGTAHLVHAARRNVDISVLVCNNFNFGMTGGQHSATTPECAVTPTTPHGAADHPFDICQTVVAGGASYVARCSALGPDCVTHIETALRTPGFAVLDLWELCVAYYVPLNKFKPPEMVEMSERLNMPFGVLRQVESSAKPSSPSGQTKPVAPADTPEETESTSIKWTGRTEITVAGSAGQRIRSACGVIGEILVGSGVNAAQYDDFPITVRKGFSISHLVISDEPIRYTCVDEPELLVVLSDDGMKRLGGLDHVRSSGMVYANASVPLSDTSATVVQFDLREAEKLVGKPSAALCLLTRAVIAHGLIDAETLCNAAETHLRGRHRDDNLRAIKTGSTTLPDRSTP
jgi:2-oxoglutarate/2-oxoacid ferredoxin oxidoreductase subunit beta